MGIRTLNCICYDILTMRMLWISNKYITVQPQQILTKRECMPRIVTLMIVYCSSPESSLRWNRASRSCFLFISSILIASHSSTTLEKQPCEQNVYRNRTLDNATTSILSNWAWIGRQISEQFEQISIGIRWGRKWEGKGSCWMISQWFSLKLPVL